MFTVTIDIWPFGDRTKAHDIVKIVGYNDGRADGSVGYNYNALIFDARYDPLPTDDEIDKARESRFADLKTAVHVRVEDHERRDGMLELIRKIIHEHGVTNVDENRRM